MHYVFVMSIGGWPKRVSEGFTSRVDAEVEAGRMRGLNPHRTFMIRRDEP